MTTKKFSVPDMHCNACVLLIEGELEDLGTKAVCDFPKQTVHVSYDQNKITERDIAQAIKKCGYTPVAFTS